MTVPATPTTIPGDILDLFEEPALGHVSYAASDGSIVTFPLWVDYDGRYLYTSSPVGSRKGHALRARPQIAVSIVSTKSPWRWLSASGRVVEIRPDERLEFIHRMARKYTQSDYGRPGPREVFVIEVDRVRTSGSWG